MPERPEETLEGKDAFLSLVAHEFRNRLTPALGYLRMVLKGTGGALTDTQQRLVTEAHKSVGRLSELTDQLSQLSLLEGGGAVFTVESVDLAALLTREVSMVPESAERGISVTFRNHTSTPTMQGDPARLRTALGTLIFSVLREQATSGELVVSLRDGIADASPALRLTIAGNDLVETLEAAEPHALAPFNEYAGGVGFRLGIARRIVERHGGRVHAPGRAPADAADPPLKPPPGVVVFLPSP